MSRKRKLVLNTTSSLLKQMISVICGFILPRLFLVHYGSSVNGLVASITQFLSLVSLFDAGMGVVIEASLYEPLAKNDTKRLGSVITSGQNFYTRFVIVLAVYIIGLSIGYPVLVQNDFGYFYTVLLIGAISISLFGQYCFGVTSSVLLSADQRGYVNYLSYAVTAIANTILSIVLIELNCSIHIVKLGSSIVFLLRPVFLSLYVRKRYKINWHEKYEGEPIKQKWNGLAQHISALVVSNTDVVVLTLFTNVSTVSVYSVYFLVVNSIKEIITASAAGIRSLIGDMLARAEYKKLNDVYTHLEWLTHTCVTLLFLITAVLLVPFVRIYTSGVYDADYDVPLFGFIISMAYAVYCLRLPYFSVIMAAGHFKQTQKSALIEALINIIISVATVQKFGLSGIAMGTLAAMTYRVVYLSDYLCKNILMRSRHYFIKNIAVDIAVMGVGIICTSKFQLAGTNFISWIMMALKTGVVACAISIFMNLFANRTEIVWSLSILRRK